MSTELAGAKPLTYLTLIGLTAGFLTTVSFVPQVWMAWRTKSTHDISFGMFSMMSAGVLLWLIYGIMLNDLPIMIANSVTLILASSIVVAKIKYR